MNFKLRSNSLALIILFISSVSSAQNMYDLSDWTVGSGITSDFNQFGNNGSNVREYGINPYGNDAVLWKAIPNPNSFAEGGIWGQYKNIDHTKTYRLSVWIKKTNSADGKGYFGCYSYDGTHHTLNLNGAANNNPYFWYGDLPELDKWYLLVGFVHHSGYSGGYQGRLYDGVTGDPIRVIGDRKFDAQATNLMMRAFLYNDPNLDDRQFIFNPRMDVVDGTEPSVEDLLGVNYSPKLVFAYDNAGNQKQRFYCPEPSCIIPNSPMGRAMPEQAEIYESDVARLEDLPEILEEDIILYPNPVIDKITLQLNSNSEESFDVIKVYNSTGAVVHTLQGNSKNELQIDLSNFSSGVYLIHMYLNNGNTVTKQIIKK